MGGGEIYTWRLYMFSAREGSLHRGGRGGGTIHGILQYFNLN